MKEKASKISKDTRVAFICKGILVGIVAGFILSLFRLITDKVFILVLNVYGLLRKDSMLAIIWAFFSLIIALFIGYLNKSEPNIKGGGIPQVKGELTGQIKMNWWSVLWRKFIGAITSASSGVFVGAPSVQLGATVGQGVNYFTKGNRRNEKILLSSGASAGIAVGFNAPIGGLLFVLEVIHNRFSPLLALTALSSAITSNFISSNIFSLQPVLGIGTLDVLPVKAFGHLIILGVILGVLGIVYNKIVVALPKIYRLIPGLSPNLYGIIPFLLVIPIGIFNPNIIGTGSEVILNLGENLPGFRIVLMILMIRFVFCMISNGGNIPGGNLISIFSLGAIIGCVYGTFLSTKYGMGTIYIKSFMILAMAGYFTAICKAPLTAIFLVAESVGSINQLAPLAIISLISYLVSYLLGGEPLFEVLLAQLVGEDEKNLPGKKAIIEIPILTEAKTTSTLG